LGVGRKKKGPNEGLGSWESVFQGDFMVRKWDNFQKIWS